MGNARFNFFITHDAWIVPTLTHFCNFKFSQSLWMNFLTGIAFVLNENNEERIVPLTGMQNGNLYF